MSNVANLASVGQLLVAVIGVWIAVHQLKRTAKASEESRDALRESLRAGELYELIQKLESLEDQIDSSGRSGEKVQTENLLVAYWRTTSLLGARVEKAANAASHDELAKKLEDLVRVAQNTKADIGRLPDGDLQGLQQQVSSFVVKSSEIAPLVAKYRESLAGSGKA